MGRDLCIKTDDGVLNIRVGAIIMKEDKFLMVEDDEFPHMYSVGGRIKFGETAEEAVVREVYEETGVKMEVDRLGFIHENFFPGDSLLKKGNIVHEISFFFYMKVPSDFEPVKSNFTEGERIENLVWIKADHPKKYYPEFFKTELSNPTKEVKHFITRNLGELEKELKVIINPNDIITVDNVDYKVIKLIGHGKGGYSYLVESKNSYYVLKKIHHEKCDFYSFGNKIESEFIDYKRLLKTKINIPKMISIDIENEIIIKEYIEGSTIYDLVKDDLMKDEYLNQVKEMAKKAYVLGLNIDYYPTNFIVDKNGILYYIDYECNLFMSNWSFEAWGIKYWSKTEEFLKTLKK